MIPLAERGMSPRGATLLGAVRTNFALLIEHEKVSPAEVAEIVEMMCAHLRSWRPLAMVASVEVAPVPKIETNDSAVSRSIDEGASYRFERIDDSRVVTLHDSHGDDACVAMSPNQLRQFIDDARSVL